MPGRKAGTPVICSHSTVLINSANSGILYGTVLGAWAHTSQEYAHCFYMTVPYELLGTTAANTAAENVAAFKTLLTSWNQAGTPLVLEWELLTPTTEAVTANAIQGVQGGMTISATSNGTAVDMEATIKILGN